MGWFERWRSKRAELRQFRSQSRRDVFEHIYETHKWGGDSRSGKGSGMARTFRVRSALPPLLDELGVTSILDVPCGDHGWMGTLDLGGRPYIGCDIVPALIEHNQQRYPDRCFRVADICEQPLPDADLVLCRDLLVHLSFADIARALPNLLGVQGRYVLCTTFPGIEKNVDGVTGKHRRLNLCLPPFGWPQPWRLIEEGTEAAQVHGKCLGLWHLPALRAARGEIFTERPATDRTGHASIEGGEESGEVRTI